MTGTPSTHDFGFAAQNIPGLTVGVVVDVVEPELDPMLPGALELGELLDDGDEAFTALVTGTPDGAIACQIPSSRWPLSSPAPVSPENR